MAVLQILPVQSPVLRIKSKPIQNFDKRINKLLKDLEETLRVQKDPIGIGLAAPQVGKLVRVFVARQGRKISLFINPEIVFRSKETNDPSPRAKIRNSKHEARNKMENTESEYIMEGCLSLPNYYGPVRRAKSIKVKFQTPAAQQPSNLVTQTKTFRGLTAQIIQHEVDHLKGILFVDHLLSQKRKLFKWERGEWVEVELA